MSGPALVLVGPPGSGKTTVGTAVAELFGVPFRDTDSDIEDVAGATIADLTTLAREYNVGRSAVTMWASRSAENGFPAPVVDIPRHRLWSRAAVKAWVGDD